MNDVLPVPLVVGIRQDQDRTLLGPGSLVAVENARLHRGGFVRKAPLVAASTGVAQYLNADDSDFRNAASAANGPAFSGFASELAEVGGRQVFITGGRAYQSNGIGAWVEGGRPSRALPIQAKWASYDDSVAPIGGSDIPNGIGKVACATLAAYTAVTYERIDVGGYAQCVLIVYDLAGSVVAEFIAGDVTAAKGRLNPRIITVGTAFYWLYQDDGTGASPFIYARKVDPTLRTIGSELQITSTKAVADGYDAVAFKGTEVLLVRRLTVGESFEVSRWTPGSSSWTLITGRTHNLATDGLSGNFLVTVYGDDQASQIWVALVMADSSGARAVGYDGALAAQVSNFDLTAWLGGAFGSTDFLAYAMPSVTRSSSGKAWCGLVFYRTVASSSVYRSVIVRLDLGAGLSPQLAGTLLHCHFGSRLYDGTATQVKAWLHTDSALLASEVTSANTYAWRTQRRYCLATIVIAFDSFDTIQAAVVQPELIPDERASFYMRAWLPQVATRTQYDENGNSATHGFVPLLVPVQVTDGGSGTESLAVLLYEWEDFSSQTSVARRALEHASGVLIVGGGLQELPPDISNRNVPRFNAPPSPEITEPRGFENGFLHAPAILTVTTSDDPTANLTPSGLYQFCATYEYVDDLGRRHRSAPSNIVQNTAPDATTQFGIQVAKATMTEREMASQAHRSVVHIYATTGNGSIFYRITPNSGAPASWDTSNTFHIVFNFTGGTDLAIAKRQILYTLGGVKPIRQAPAHRFGARGNGRVILGGLFDPRLVEVSRFERQNQPTEFTRDDTFRTLLPERCTGLAFLDGNFVAFTRRAIYLISGASLPDDKGSPALSNPVRLPSTVGCIDWRSVVETPDGIVFQSERGVYVLPRGFGQPVLISAQVQDDLRGRRVISACAVADPGSEYQLAGASAPVTPSDRATGQHLLVLSVCAPDQFTDADAGKLLVYDLERHAWLSTDDTGAGSSLGALVANLGGKLAIASRSQSTPDIRKEAPNSWDTEASSLPMRLSLADLRPFGILTQGGMLRVQVLGEIRSDRAKLSATVCFEGEYSKAKALTPLTIRGTPGDKFVAEWSLPARRVAALGIDLEVTDGGVAGEGLSLQAVGVELLPPKGRSNVGAARRAA